MADLRMLLDGAADGARVPPNGLERTMVRFRRRQRNRRLLAGGVALAVFIAALSLAAVAFLGNRSVVPVATPTPSSPVPSGDPWASFGKDWTRLPDAPQTRDGAALAWTGRHLIYWGGTPHGATSPLTDGYAFAPETMTWSPIPPAPGPGRYDARAMWTGTEVLFLGGSDTGRLDGVALDPSTHRWRQIPPAPIEPRIGGVYVWTGTEAIVWGGGREGEPANTGGAAYDPKTNAWRAIATAPIGLNLASGIWTGREMIVFGSLLNGRNIATTRHAVGAAYEPATDTWRQIAPSDLSPQSSAAVWTGDRLIAWDYDFHAEEYVPATDTWRHIPRVPVRQFECYVDGASIRDVVFAWDCGDAATLDPGTDQWHKVIGGVTALTTKANGATYKLFRFASLAPAGDVLALEATGITVGNKGVPCYGCPGAPVSFWVYRTSGA